MARRKFEIKIGDQYVPYINVCTTYSNILTRADLYQAFMQIENLNGDVDNLSPTDFKFYNNRVYISTTAIAQSIIDKDLIEDVQTLINDLILVLQDAAKVHSVKSPFVTFDRYKGIYTPSCLFEFIKLTGKDRLNSLLQTILIAGKHIEDR